MDKVRTEPESLPIAQWVIDVIESCNHPVQMEFCQNLVSLYRERFKDDHMENINRAFHTQSVKIGYYQYKETREKEKHMVFIPENEPVS